MHLSLVFPVSWAPSLEQMSSLVKRGANAVRSFVQAWQQFLSTSLSLLLWPCFEPNLGSLLSRLTYVATCHLFGGRRLHSLLQSRSLLLIVAPNSVGASFMLSLIGDWPMVWACSLNCYASKVVSILLIYKFFGHSCGHDALLISCSFWNWKS